MKIWEDLLTGFGATIASVGFGYMRFVGTVKSDMKTLFKWQDNHIEIHKFLYEAEQKREERLRQIERDMATQTQLSKDMLAILNRLEKRS